jgi:hypothetical protein
MIDKYSLHARVYPMLLTLLPIFILGVTYSIDFQNLWHIGISALVVSSLTFLFSQLGRDQGKKKEAKLWLSWGGPPTVLLLRLRSPYLNQHTKARYHAKLQQLCPVTKNPTVIGESANPKAFDDVYGTWSDYIRTHTRDTNEFNLLFKENVNYGFRRNLWGLKSIAITIVLLSGLINYLIFAIQSNQFNFLLLTNEFYIASGVLLFILIIWVFGVTKNFVKIPAFAYAIRLCEAIEKL